MSDDFKIVTHKNKKYFNSELKKLHNGFNSNILEDSQNRTLQIKKIEEAKGYIINSDLYDSVKASLTEALIILKNPNIYEIICIGLGKIGECMVSRFQLAFLLCLKDRFNISISVYDPIFNEDDIWIIEKFNINLLTENVEGKYKIKNKCTTLFYLPHCSKQLTNNLLWTNWGSNLNYCIIIANSFNTIIDTTSKRVLKNLELIRYISPHAIELAIINTFKYYEIFNDTAIHIFPWDKLKLLPDDFWNLPKEPQYIDDDVEFIRNKLEQTKLVK